MRILVKDEFFNNRRVHTTAFFSHGWILVTTHEPQSAATISILERFASVFNLTYRRFLDLQTAESQAREAQIEAALERVRARSMAMYNSSELHEVAEVLFQQLWNFGGNILNAGIVLCRADADDDEYWMSSDTGIRPVISIPHTDDPIQKKLYEGWKNKTEFYSEAKSGDELKEHFNYLRSVPALQPFFEEGINSNRAFPTWQKWHAAYFSHGYLFLLTADEYDEEKILVRFAKIFEQAYTRFLDLQKAEAQAREAQIEAALERVRSRTMGMQHSHELKDAAQLLFQQIQDLGVHLWACGYNIWEEDKRACTAWMSAEGTIQTPFRTPGSEDVFVHFYEAALRGEDLYVEEIKGETCEAHYRYLSKLPVAGDVMKGWEAAGIAYPKSQIFHIAYFKQGYLMFISYEPVTEAHDIFRRFAKVFEQTFTRFLDLQKAEAQAMEAVKRASVDRVRAEIASMRTTKDLERITPLIWNELSTLGVPFFRCGVFIMDEEKQEVQSYLSTPEGSAIAAFRQPYNTPGEISEMVVSWHKKELYKQYWNEEKFIEFTQSLVDQHAITSGEKNLTENHPNDLYLHFIPFLQGMLYAGSTAPLTENELQLVQNLADAFSTAYARYEDFNKLEAAKEEVDKTLTDLKQTQAKLVQSEKMASLGELTAGIAHEIQNPLNFVNNFSELNKELLADLNKEIEEGNYEEVKLIAQDLTGNEEKISHHGRRAEAIVKGMLQHSRTGITEKEATNINKLADEYFHLAYHGLRGKDKSFNALLKADYDDGIGDIHVIPQDIGRVLLNIFNNAFYAVNEKKKDKDRRDVMHDVHAMHGISETEIRKDLMHDVQEYQPQVYVSTKKKGNQVEITVKDNGNGIPENIIDKIFQPFFTTKPTGQGTGLGLSLAYDIITKGHGGELTVNCAKAGGSEFVIILPDSSRLA